MGKKLEIIEVVCDSMCDEILLEGKSIVLYIPDKNRVYVSKNKNARIHKWGESGYAAKLINKDGFTRVVHVPEFVGKLKGYRCGYFCGVVDRCNTTKKKDLKALVSEYKRKNKNTYLLSC